MRVECVFIVEEVIAEVERAGLDVGAVELGGNDAVVDELMQVLREAAAEVERGGQQW